MPYIIALENSDMERLGINEGHITRLCQGSIVSSDTSIPGSTFFKMIGIVPNDLPEFIEVIEVIPIECAVDQS